MLSQRQPLLRKAVPMSIGRKVVYPGQGPCPIGAVVKKIMIREISETTRKRRHMRESCLDSALGLHRGGS